MKYMVTLLVDASIWVEVEADNEEDALEAALDHEDACAPILCHQCSGELDVGDILPEGHIVSKI